MKVASDLDGVISTIHSNWIIDDLMYYCFGSYWGWFRHRNCKVITGNSNIINTIITGRPESDRWYTENWLLKNNIKYENLIMNKLGTMDEYKIAEWKVKYLIENKFDCYYDDSMKAFIFLNKNLESRIIKDVDYCRIILSDNIFYKIKIGYHDDL